MTRYSRWNPIDDPAEPTIEKYLFAHRQTWAETSYASFKERLYKFHRYLEKRGILLTEISNEDLLGYRRYLRWSQVTENSVTQYMRTIATFYRWLSSEGCLKSSLYDLGLERPKFDLLESHLASLSYPYAIKIHRIYGTEFHVYLAKNGIEISKLDKKDLEAYERQLRTQQPTRQLSARRINMRCVHSHVKWLCDKGIIDKSPAYFGINRLKFHNEIDVVLPKVAKKYLKLAEGYRSPRTVKGYSTNLKHLYMYLGENQLSLGDFDRSHFEQFIWLKVQQGYSQAALKHHISDVQQYLTWMFQCGHLSQNPEPLIRDFPRPQRTESLPRYLPVEVDKIVQEKLSSSDAVNAWGLYLMRRIGIRISDLRELCFDCIFQDERGLNFIKIPPGKLKRERLFPLDNETLRLVKNIQHKSLVNTGGKTPEKLIIHTSGRPPQEKEYYEILYEISEHIRLDRGMSVGPESLVSHRLRHTFATTLINAGISIEALKELLGHRDIKMTLKYARVMPETIRKDYLSALDKIKNEIKAPELAITKDHVNSDDMLGDILKRLRAKHREHPQQQTKIKSLIRRVERLKADLNDFV